LCTLNTFTQVKLQLVIEMWRSYLILVSDRRDANVEKNIIFMETPYVSYE